MTVEIMRPEKKVEFKHYHHMSLAIGYVRRLLNEEESKGHPQDIIKEDGNLVSYERAKEKLNELEQKGYDVIPACENIDERGCCTGHSKGEE